LENRVSELEKQMANPDLYSDPDALAAAAKEHKLLTEELEQAYEVWDRLTEQLAADGF